MVTPSSLGLDLYKAIPSGVNLRANSMLKSCEVSFGGNTICVDLIVLDMFDFYVIISMDCLSEYRAHTICQEKRVLFSPLNGHFFEFEGRKVKPLPQMISAM